MVFIAIKAGLDSKLWHLDLEVDWFSLEVATASLLIGVFAFELLIPLPCWPNSIL